MSSKNLARWQARRQTAVQAVNAFAGDLCRHLQNEPGNLFVSPFSLHAILDLAFRGAAGDTATEMAQVLHWDPLCPCTSMEAVTDFPRLSPSPALAIASAMWMQKEASLQPTYRAGLADFGGAEIQPVDFLREPEASRERINHWIAEKTRQKITHMIPPGAIHPLTRFLLTNAIYFKADWFDKFDKDSTTEEPFHLADGSTIAVQMMHQKSKLSAMDEDRFLGVTLCYNPMDFAMTIFVPRDVNDLEWLEQEILSKGHAAWKPLRQHREVILSLPRFRIETIACLRPVLHSMGMAKAFDPFAADFRGISSDEKFGISELLHQTCLTVDEEGTEAAGASAMILSTGAAPNNRPLEVNVDRPFLLTIEYAPPMDAANPVILFMGRVMQPAGIPIPKVQGAYLTSQDDGFIVDFLKANCFRVHLRDGREIDAVMADELIPLAREAHLHDESLVVSLEYRAIGLPRIIKARYK